MQFKFLPYVPLFCNSTGEGLKCELEKGGGIRSGTAETNAGLCIAGKSSLRRSPDAILEAINSYVI